MTCVWDSLCQGILPLRHTPTTLLKHLKDNNTKPNDVSMNSNTLSEKQMQENIDHVESISVKQDGYLCGLFDPLIVAYCHVFKVNVKNTISGYTVDFSVIDATKTVFLNSNGSHMSCTKA